MPVARRWLMPRLMTEMQECRGVALDLPGTAAMVRPLAGTLEGWPSGLRRTLGKRVCVNSVPWVRIPLPPPAFT
ncbi:protein of unknown function [Rhodovastum atsumiense]|nr:protein of unknown function [Rhodovastum atsumiense]